MKWEYDEVLDWWFVRVGDFTLAVGKNTGPTAFGRCEEPRPFGWSIERNEPLPMGDAMTVEEAKAAATEALRKLR